MRKLVFLFLLLVSCGREEYYDTDIVGGQPVARSFYAKVGGCGGTLIAPRWIVSAAHCFNGSNPKEAAIGLYDRNDPENGGKPIDRVKIKRLIKHPKWVFDHDKNRWKGYDLALIELKRASNIKPIEMHEGRDPPDGYRIQTYGFGGTRYGGNAPQFLQGTTLVFDKEATDRSRESIIRAKERGKAVCHGDSGGPLVYVGRLLASTTFTIEKCHAGSLMGFTRLDVDWIKRTMRSN